MKTSVAHTSLAAEFEARAVAIGEKDGQARV